MAPYFIHAALISESLAEVALTQLTQQPQQQTGAGRLGLPRIACHEGASPQAMLLHLAAEVERTLGVWIPVDHFRLVTMSGHQVAHASVAKLRSLVLAERVEGARVLEMSQLFVLFNKHPEDFDPDALHLTSMAVGAQADLGGRLTPELPARLQPVFWGGFQSRIALQLLGEPPFSDAGGRTASSKHLVHPAKAILADENNQEKALSS